MNPQLVKQLVEQYITLDREIKAAQSLRVSARFGDVLPLEIASMIANNLRHQHAIAKSLFEMFDGVSSGVRLSVFGSKLVDFWVDALTPHRLYWAFVELPQDDDLPERDDPKNDHLAQPLKSVSPDEDIPY